MSRGRDSLLGLGGQRKKLSKSELRGKDSGQAAGTGDPLADKRELLRKMREKSAPDSEKETGAQE